MSNGVSLFSVDEAEIRESRETLLPLDGVEWDTSDTA